ncbi:hypothetical protein [uncultured Bacteroides sp.]|uniref:hypothetical protein n=1 Tax=uncultured Bacteroides sp. TaxID=162156 RepID=UPI0023C3D3B6|nr:hypothetical protein [uncultured Bacteroides sp.]MDE6171720.1 hypothetical protein [Bacteroides sp.]
MKHPHGYLFILLLLLPILYACNSEIFLDEVKLPFTQATLNGDGDTLTIRFNTSKWILNGAGTYNGSFGSNYYTLSGMDMGPAPICHLAEPGKVVVTNADRELSFIRPNERELQVCIGINPEKTPFEFELYIADEIYQQQEIHFTQQAGSGYTIDRIEYSLIPNSIRTDTVSDLFLIVAKNSDESTETRTYNLNDLHKRNILLSCATSLNLTQTGDEKPSIELPSADISQGIKLGTDRIPYFQYSNALVDMTLEPPYIHTVILKPGINQIYRIVKRQVYSANYTLYLRSTKTGKIYSVQGRLRSETPIETIGCFVQREKYGE